MNLLYYIAMKKTPYVEKVNHETEARPFSVHRTVVPEDMTNALYLHCHPEAEFFYLEEGEITFHVEEQVFTVKEGEGMFIPPELIHNAWKADGAACSYSAVVFSPSWLTGYLKEGNLYTRALWENRYHCVTHLRGPGDEEILNILSDVSRYMGQPVGQYEMRLLGELLICFQELYNSRFSQIKMSDRETGSSTGIQRSLAFMGEHYGEDLTLKQIADSSGYSESHFCHAFKEQTGHTPFGHLNRLRVIRASEQLELTGDRITDIAMRCGFDNISYFNRTFRKQMGISPGEYRKNVRRNEWKEEEELYL